MNLVQEVQNILSENLVSFGEMTLTNANTLKHHIVTDKERVFVRILRPSNDPKLLQTEVDFGVYTGYGTNPLLETIYHKSSQNQPFIMSAFEWENMYPIGTNMTPIQAAHAARELFLIHSSKRYERLNTSSLDAFVEYGERLNSPSFNYLSADTQNRLKEIFREIIQPTTELISMNPDLNVVSHGKAIPENLMMREDYTVFWTDYEKARSAPREYDLAYLFLHVNYRLKRPEMWTVIQNEYQTLLGREVNEYLINQFASLILSRRALTLASQTLHTHKEEELKAFIKELAPLLKGVMVQEVQNFRYLH